MNPHYVAAANEFTINVKANFGISKIQFSSDTRKKLLAVSTWDGFVKVFDVTNPNSPTDVRTYYHTKPVLCCTFVDSSKVVSAGLDEVVKVCDLESARETVMGQHTDGVRCLEFCTTMRVAVSGGWDGLMKLWDIRALMPVGAMECGDKVYALDVVDNRAVIGTKDRRVLVWDVRNMKQPLQSRESPLKFQTRAIKCFPSGEAFVLSSIEGRVAVEYFDQDPEVQRSKYAFKCHRVKDESGELIYPVNAIAFHPVYRTFATGGSDNMVNMWDPFNRKRLCQFRRFPTSVASLSFSADGSMLSIASSYLYEEDIDPTPIPESTLTIRKMTELECEKNTTITKFPSLLVISCSCKAYDMIAMSKVLYQTFPKDFLNYNNKKKRVKKTLVIQYVMSSKQVEDNSAKYVHTSHSGVYSTFFCVEDEEH